MTGIDPGTAAVLLILGACFGVELTRIAIDWNYEPRNGGTMKHLTTIIIALALWFTACDPAEPRGCADIEHDRVFADVPFDHPFCAEIESLYRDGITSGCRTEVKSVEVSCPSGAPEDECQFEEIVTRYFCPEEPLTRAAGAAFAEHSDPFAQIDRDGRMQIGDHVVNAERFDKGHYWIQFGREVQRCSMEAWPHDREGPGVEVDVDHLSPTIDTVEVFTTVNGNPTDMWFSVRIHCR